MTPPGPAPGGWQHARTRCLSTCLSGDIGARGFTQPAQHSRQPRDLGQLHATVPAAAEVVLHGPPFCGVERAQYVGAEQDPYLFVGAGHRARPTAEQPRAMTRSRDDFPTGRPGPVAALQRLRATPGTPQLTTALSPASVSARRRIGAAVPWLTSRPPTSPRRTATSEIAVTVRRAACRIDSRTGSSGIHLLAAARIRRTSTTCLPDVPTALPRAAGRVKRTPRQHAAPDCRAVRSAARRC